jgi:hypothetical protein
VLEITARVDQMPQHPRGTISYPLHPSNALRAGE